MTLYVFLFCFMSLTFLFCDLFILGRNGMSACSEKGSGGTGCKGVVFEPREHAVMPFSTAGHQCPVEGQIARGRPPERAKRYFCGLNDKHHAAFGQVTGLPARIKRRHKGRYGKEGGCLVGRLL